MAAVPNAADPGLLASLARLSRSLLAHARMRLQLLGLELEQEKERLLVVMLAALLAYLFLGMTLVLVALGVIVHFWDTPDRLASVIWMALITAVLTVGSGWFAFSRLSRPSTLFHASLAELIDDEDALSNAALPATDGALGEALHDGP